MPIDDPAYIQPLDLVVLIDTDRQYPEGQYEEAQVVATTFADVPVGAGEVQSALMATLDRDLQGAYLPSPLDFSEGRSAAVGVISCDRSKNQLNGTDSCFYDVDLRAVENPYAEAFVELIAPGVFLGTSPYLCGVESPEHWEYTWLWSNHHNEDATVHLLGAERDPLLEGVLGITRRWISSTKKVRTSMVNVKTIEENSGGSGSTCFFLKPAFKVIEGATDHELAHQFAMNILNPGEHCHSEDWQGGGECMMHTGCDDPGHYTWCPGIDSNRLDADAASTTTNNGGDIYDVRFCVETLP